MSYDGELARTEPVRSWPTPPFWLTSRLILSAILTLALCCACDQKVSATAHSGEFVDGRLTIDRSFNPLVEFHLSEDRGRVVLRTVMYADTGPQTRPTVAHDFHSRLSETDSAKVRTAVRETLAAPLLPPGGMLLDGSTWSLQFTAPRPLRKDVQSPDFNASKRGTQALHDLGDLLWHLAKMPDNNPLY